MEPRLQDKIPACEFVRWDDSEWFCSEHGVLMVAKKEPVFCIVGWEQQTREYWRENDKL